MAKARDLANLGSNTAALATDAEVTSAVSTAVPSQTGQNGKYLTTNGTATSWGSVTTDPIPNSFLLMGA